MRRPLSRVRNGAPVRQDAIPPGGHYRPRNQRTPALRSVRTGASHPDGVEVLAGLKAGDQVALDPVRAGLTGARPQ